MPTDPPSGPGRPTAWARLRFILVLAARDSRASRRRLLLMSLAIVLGVAALVAITSFRDNLRAALAREAKGVLGADLELSGRAAFGPEEEALFARLGGEQAREVNLNSMAFFPRTEDSRLVLVRALTGGFPWYGELGTSPAGARARLDAGEAVALVEESLLLQFDARPGDRVRLGTMEFTIAAALVQSPGEAAAFGTVAPRIYIPLSHLAATGLVREGSFARYRQYFRLPEGVEAEAVIRAERESIRRLRLGTETVAERQQDLGRVLDRAYSFLNLSGFVALLLGAVGVGAAMASYIRPKLATVATLRCLGASPSTAFLVFLVQGVVTGLVGASAGAVLGVAVQLALPSLLATVLPVAVPAEVSWPAVGEGLLVGAVVCLLVVLWPLLAVRRVSPLRAIRAGIEEEPTRDPARTVVGAGIVCALVGLSLSQSSDWRHGLGFAAAVAVAFAVLAGAARLLMRAVRRLLPAAAPYVWRQGLANLYRPHNRTVLVLVAVGLGTFLVTGLFLTRSALLADFAASGSGDRPNLVVWDIQPDQLEGVRAVLRREQAEPRSEAAVVTMRLSAINERTVEQVLADPATRVPAWRLRREYRSTWRTELAPTETIAAGRWTGRFDPQAAGGAPVPISIEQEMARELGLKVGDRLRWDIFGLPLETEVGSIRVVDWRGFNPNFFVVFPSGVLEEAPAFYLLAARSPGVEEAARLQRALGRDFPGVSIIDLRAVLETLDTIFSQVGWVVQFMALFTVLTGIIVLAGALLAGRFQRLREVVLLRTLGAGRGQIRGILLVEYTLLGAGAAVLGAGLAWAGSWAVLRGILQLESLPPAGPVGVAILAVSALTVAVGWMTSWRLVDAPPLEILRAER